MSADRLEFALELILGGFSLQVSESLPLQGTSAVFGPSGAGKSSLLRAVAGFERAARGTIHCGDSCWLDTARGRWLAPHRRDVGFVFQDGRLFEHLDVAGNLLFALRRGRAGAGLFDEIVQALDLQGLLQRGVDGLSGGERQRVALGRALLGRPRLLLLDEPLASLDLGRRAEILPYLEGLYERFGVPAIYVSHAIDEVTRLAARTLVLHRGRVVAHGPTAEIMRRLDLQDLTGRAEFGVLLDGTLLEHDARLQLDVLDVAGQRLSMPATPGLRAGDRVRIRVRARDVALARKRPEAISIRNVLEGQLRELSLDAGSAYCEVLVDVGGLPLRSRITRAAAEALALAPGDRLFVLVKTVSLEDAGA